MHVALIALLACAWEAGAAPAALHLADPVRQGASNGLVLEERAWTYGDEAGWAWIARLPRTARLRVHPSDIVQPLSAFPPVAEGEVLVNGGFYEDGPMGLVVHEGQVRSPLTTRGGSGVLFGSPAGVDVVHRDGWPRPATEAVQSIDRLVDGGRSLVKARPDADSSARAAVAVTADAVLVVVLVAGRPDPARPNVRDGAGEFDGIPLWTFAQLLVDLGAERALNLDGGISVELRARVEGRDYVMSGGPGTINAVRLSAGELPHPG